MKAFVLFYMLIASTAYAGNFDNKNSCILEIIQNEQNLKTFCDGKLVTTVDVVSQNDENLKLTLAINEALVAGLKLVSCSERPLFSTFAVRTCVLARQ